MKRVRSRSEVNITFLYQPGRSLIANGAVKEAITITTDGVDLTDDQCAVALQYDSVYEVEYVAPELEPEEMEEESVEEPEAEESEVEESGLFQDAVDPEEAEEEDMRDSEVDEPEEPSEEETEEEGEAEETGEEESAPEAEETEEEDTNMYYCNECEHRHNRDSDIGESHASYEGG